MGAVPMAVPHTRPIAVTHHANNPDLAVRRQPVARRAADPVQRPGPGRAAAGGVVARRDGLRRAHPALPRPARLPAGVACRCSSTSSAPAMVTVDLTELREASDAASEEVTTLPRRQRRRSPRWCRRSSSSTTRSSAPSRRATACSPTTSRSRRARRSAGSSSSSWPVSTRPEGDDLGGADAVVRRGARRAPRHRDSRHRPLPRAAAPTPTGSASSAARSRRRR